VNAKEHGNLLLPNDFPPELHNVAHLPQQQYCTIKNMRQLYFKNTKTSSKGKIK
jgi:hypothetical protein